MGGVALWQKVLATHDIIESVKTVFYGLLLLACASLWGADYSALNWTEEEKKRAENFDHDARNKRLRDKACGKDKKGQAACEGREAKAWGISPDIVRMVSTTYAMFMGGGVGGGITSGTEKTKGRTDYCRWVAVAGEALAQFQQQGRQQLISNSSSAKSQGRQKDLLYQQAAAHSARADTAEMQVMSWGSTATCYAVMAASLNFQKISKGTYIKMGAALALGLFYSEQKKRHKEYARIVTDIAEALPGKGACNPITERNCYCSDPDTPLRDKKKNNCWPEDKKRPGPPGTVAVSCIDAQLQPDPACRCAVQKTCADVKFNSLFNLPEFSPQTPAGRSLANMARLLNGRYNPAALAKSSLGQGAFRRILNLADKNISVEDGPLTADQKKLAQALFKRGVPKRLAAGMARAPTSARGRSFANRFRGQFDPKKKEGGNFHVSLAGQKSSRKKKSSRLAKAIDPFKKKRVPQHGDEIIRFTEDAQSEASISRDRDGNLFKLISHRYQRSGWEKLQFSAP